MWSDQTPSPSHGNHEFMPEFQHFNQRAPPNVTSEELAAASMAASMDRWIVFDPCQSSFNDWLNSNLPSSTYRTDGIGMIAVKSPTNQEAEYPIDDLTHLQEDWELLGCSGRPINRQTITELAKTYNISRGKWLFHTSTGIKVNHLWSLVAEGVAAGRCGTMATVTPYDSNKDEENHVICVYNSNFTDYQDILETENGIRSVGIKCPLLYKPEVYSMLGIYRNNEWGLKPTLYRSVFDVIQCSSKVMEHFSL